MLFITLFTCGAIVLGLGVFLYKTKKIEIIKGYDSRKQYDRDGLAKFEGKNYMYAGGLLIILGILNLIFQYGAIFLVALGASFILVMVISLKSIDGRSKYIILENEKAAKIEKRRNKMILIAVLIFVAIIGAIIGVIFGIEVTAKTQFNVNGKDVQIKAGLESTSFNLDDIKKVYIKNTIPSFSKNSGLDTKQINRGRFNVSGYGDGYIFLETNKGPYLYVILKNGFVIINSKEASKVNSYYHKIN